MITVVMDTFTDISGQAVLPAAGKLNDHNGNHTHIGRGGLPRV